MGMTQSYLRVDNETLNNFIADSRRLEDIAFKQNIKGRFFKNM